MSRDTRDRRPPLRASELPPTHVMLALGEPRAVVCPGCGSWQVPRAGHLRRHGDDRRHGDRWCPQSGRAVWFDLTPYEWQASLAIASRDGRYRRPTRVRGVVALPTPPPVHRVR
jgi:hypothetical protein